MYKVVDVVQRIKSSARQKGVKISDILISCDLSKNALSSMNSRGSWIRANSLAKIADYLGVSVDYLLGRTDTPQAIGGYSIKIEEIHGDHSADVSISNVDIDKETLEIARMIKKLSVVQKAETVLKINEMINKK